MDFSDQIFSHHRRPPTLLLPLRYTTPRKKSTAIIIGQVVLFKMPTKREKSFRCIGYCTILLMYSTFMVDKAINLLQGFILSPSRTHAEKLSTPVIIQPAGTELETNESAHKVSIRRAESASDFIYQFEEILTDPSAYENFAALVIKDGRVYCRRGQLNSLSRGKYYVDMLNEGLLQNLDHSELKKHDTIPVIVKHDDSNGCYPSNQYDKYEFPRLTWSIPSNNENNWCAVVGMPSYKAWREANRSVIVNEMYWDHTFRENAREYPWDSKLNMAVWRGSTTFNKGLYGSLDFHDIPRAKLVQKAEESALIDAAFHKIVGKYQADPNLQHSNKAKVSLKEAIPLKEMMRYKGKRVRRMPFSIMNQDLVYLNFILAIQSNYRHRW